MNNKYEQAILNIEKNNTSEDLKEDIKLLKELARKSHQYYVKATPNGIGGDGHYAGTDGAVYFCPICNEELYTNEDVGYYPEYCDSCGQHLSWEGIN